jgi:hypothetical protein
MVFIEQFSLTEQIKTFLEFTQPEGLPMRSTKFLIGHNPEPAYSSSYHQSIILQASVQYFSPIYIQVSQAYFPFEIVE